MLITEFHLMVHKCQYPWQVSTVCSYTFSSSCHFRHHYLFPCSRYVCSHWSMHAYIARALWTLDTLASSIPSTLVYTAQICSFSLPCDELAVILSTFVAHHQILKCLRNTVISWLTEQQYKAIRNSNTSMWTFTQMCINRGINSWFLIKLL